MTVDRNLISHLIQKRMGVRSDAGTEKSKSLKNDLSQKNKEEEIPEMLRQIFF